MRSRYVLQVAEIGGKVVASWPPGLDEERDLVEAVVRGVRDADVTEKILASVQAKGVGLLKTEAHVLAAVREAIEAHTPATARGESVRAAFEAALHAVKVQVKP